MSCEQIRAYAEGWARFQGRMHGGDDQEPEEELDDEEQVMLARYMMGKSKNA